MATILTKKKDTTGAPVAGDLTNSTGGAELAVNTADKRLYTKDSGGNVVEVGTNPGTAVTFTAGTVSAPAITTTGDTNTGVFFPAADTIAFAEGGAEAMRINSDSQVVTTAGTASLPAITTTGDVNTGIFFPAADTIAFAEGGAEAMRIDSDGDVGIGTSSPVAKNHIKGSGTSGQVTASWILENSSSGTAGMDITGSAGTSRWRFLYGGGPGTGTNSLTESMCILTEGASAGNVGIGTSSPGTNLQINSATGGAIRLQYTGNSGYGQVETNSNNELVFKTSGANERMRIDSSGNVGIGTSSPTFVTGGGLQISNATQANLRLSDTTNSGYNFDLFMNDTDAYVANRANGPLYFFTNNTERARITSGGYFKASNDGNYTGSASAYHEFRTTANDWILNTRNTASSGDVYGFFISFNGQTPNNTTSRFFACSDTTNDKCIIYSTGTITNRTGTYNSFSDLKLKQDVVDASSQWDDIKALRIVKYRLKDEVAADPNYPAYIGVIAQEVEQVSPGLVDNCPDFEEVTKTREVEKTREVTPAVLDDEGNEVTPAVTETYTETEEYTERVATGTVTKSVKSSIIYMKAVKALQEAMTRIETLETQNAAFEARLAALEAK